jgi:hypothetical protein
MFTYLPGWGHGGPTFLCWASGETGPAVPRRCTVLDPLAGAPAPDRVAVHRGLVQANGTATPGPPEPTCPTTRNGATANAAP